MTQIIAGLGPRFLIQASDRLVSLSGSLKPHDTNATKTIILSAIDGVALIGYCGLAYMDGVPTDQWMAQVLTGQDLSHRPLLQGGQHAHHSEPLHFLIGRLALALQEALRSHAGYTHHVLVVGWTYKQSGSRPSSYMRRMDWVNGVWNAGSVGSRLKFHDNRFWLASIPLMTSEELAPLATRLAAWRLDDGAEPIQEALTQTIRGLARRGVGADCLATVVTFVEPPPVAWVRFVPAGPIQEAFTPWVISPDGLSAPIAEMGGGESISSYWGLDVRVASCPPPPDSNVLLSLDPVPGVPPP